MKYHIDGLVVASELAAKPPSQASHHLLAFLKNCDRVTSAVDYGCGKLRYAAPLAAIANSLTLVDSPEQLDRLQNIDGKETTVRRLVEEAWPTVRVETVSQFQAKTAPKFDFALCANVLSAIPSKAARSKALSAIRIRLKANGRLLVVNQHTNSHYCSVPHRPSVLKHLDGWLVPGRASASYYGILNRQRTSQILESAGFQVTQHWIEGQSNYALAQIS